MRPGGGVVTSTLPVLLVLAGCGAYLPGASAPRGVRYLPGGGDEEGEFGILLEKPRPPEPERPVEPVVPAAPAEREWRLGLRTGLFATGASEDEWGPTFCVGTFYRAGPGAKVLYEAGVDYAPVDSADGSTSSKLFFLRGEALFGNWDPEKSTSFYFLAGAQGIGELASLNGSGGRERRIGSGANLGLGMGSVRGSWDLRTVYSVVLGSDNSTGGIFVVAGTSF